MKYVTSYGGLYKLTDKEYAQALKDIANGKGYDLPDKRMIGQVEYELAGITQEQAQTLINSNS